MTIATRAIRSRKAIATVYRRRPLKLWRCTLPSPVRLPFRASWLSLNGRGRNWASFNLREDQFDGLRMDAPVDLVAADGKSRTKAHVPEILARGEFAMSRMAGDHDPNTFLVCANRSDVARSGR